MFLSKIQAASDDRSPWGDFWFQPVGGRSFSGVQVTTETAQQLSAVFRAVSLLSGHLAMLPLDLKKVGTNQRVKSHWLYDLWKKPNPWQNGFEWRRMGMAHLLYRGNFFNEIVDNRKGEVVQLLPRHPDRIRVELLDNGDYRYVYKEPSGTERAIPRGQMFHLRGLSSDGIMGISVIEAARQSMGMGLAAQEYGARFFANDAKPTGGWIEVPGKFADKEARRKFRDSIQDAQSSANRGKMMVLDQGMQYHEIGINNRDSQFLESRKFQISEIARWFGVPPHKLADLERSTNNNIEHQGQEYVTDSLLIWAETFEAGIDDVLLFDDEGLESEFNFKKLLRGDSSTRYSNYGKGINDGWLTRNEAREEEGMEPLEGLDEPLRPLNMVEESDAEDQAEDVEETEPPEQEAKEKPEGEEAAKRLQALLESNAARLARRAVKDMRLDPQLVSEALAVPLEAAEAWGRLPWNNETFTVENLTASLIALGNQA